MADVRALLAAERQSRRILHPHLTYSKSGALTCNVCNLNIKSEQLWPGHLKSANHRKNAANIQDHLTKNLKRKIDDVEEKTPEPRDYEVDSRKKPKSQSEALLEQEADTPDTEIPKTVPQDGGREEDANGHAYIEQPQSKTTETVAVAVPVVDTVDEDEWAAFERDVAPLAQPDYSTAVITAAPVTAAELAAQEEADRRRNRENEADDEKEDEGRRMEDEFEVMEEMEDRLKKLKEKREALRTQVHTTDRSEAPQPEDDRVEIEETQITAPVNEEEEEEEEEDDDEDEDDWYGR